MKYVYFGVTSFLNQNTIWTRIFKIIIWYSERFFKVLCFQQRTLFLFLRFLSLPKSFVSTADLIVLSFLPTFIFIYFSLQILAYNFSATTQSISMEFSYFLNIDLNLVWKNRLQFFSFFLFSDWQKTIPWKIQHIIKITDFLINCTTHSRPKTKYIQKSKLTLWVWIVLTLRYYFVCFLQHYLCFCIWFTLNISHIQNVIPVL